MDFVKLENGKKAKWWSQISEPSGGEFQRIFLQNLNNFAVLFLHLMFYFKNLFIFQLLLLFSLRVAQYHMYQEYEFEDHHTFFPPLFSII